MSKFDNNMIFRLVLIVLAAFVLFALINYYNSKQNSAKVEKFYVDALQSKPYESPLLTQNTQAPKEDAKVSSRPQASEEEANEVYRTVDFSSQKLPSDCFPKDRLTADDLLPKDAANLKFSTLNPAGQGALSDLSLLSAGHNIGISSIGGTLRNANLQLRSEPPNPQINIGPFNNTTISPDVMRRPFELNGDC